MKALLSIFAGIIGLIVYINYKFSKFTRHYDDTLNDVNDSLGKLYEKVDKHIEDTTKTFEKTYTYINNHDALRNYLECNADSITQLNSAFEMTEGYNNLR